MSINKPEDFFGSTEHYLLRAVVFLLFALKLFEFAVHDIRSNALFAATNPPIATHCSQPTEELATEGSDEDSSGQMCNGTGDRVPSKSESSRLRRHGKAPPGRSCSNRMCCRASK